MTILKNENMKELIVVYSTYKANTAPGNRLLGFLKDFVRLGIKTTLVLIYPDRNHGEEQITPEGFTIKRIWGCHKYKNRYWKVADTYYKFYRYIKSLPDESNILILGGTMYIPMLSRAKNINVFHERTENPEIINVLPLGFQRLYYNSCRNIAGIFGISTRIRDFFKEKGVRNAHVINMTVDSNRFTNLSKKVDDRYGKYIAYCGTVSNNKDGVDILIKSFSKIAPNHPDIKLVIIGKIPKKEEEQSNLKLIETLDLKDRIILTGEVEFTKMPQLLKNAEVLLLARPSGLQAEFGFPTKLGEYLLTENPVLITRVGDIPLFLKDSESAYIVEPNDVDAFANKLNWILENPDKASIVGPKGKEVALHNFNSTIESEKIINIIFNKL